MKFRGWAVKPPWKPPLASTRPPPAPPPPLLTSAAPPTFSPPLPPALLAAQQRVEARFACPAPRPPPRPPLPALEHSAAHHELATLLQDLPPIAGSPLEPHLRLRSNDAIKHEVQRWLQACYRAHALLSGPLRGEELQFRNKVVRVVAHTIRLLVRVRMYGQARELDRAFFSRKESSRGGRKTGGTSAEGEVGGGGDQGRGRQQQRAARLAGKGLGLKRGNINIAWMQSLGLRLELRDNTGTEEFGDVLKQLREEQGGAQGINSHIISFLLRKGELLQIKLREDGMREGQARRQVQRMLEGIRGSERMGQVDVVRLALVETAMGEMEKEVKGRGRVDPQAFAQLEQDVRNLVGEMEALEGEEEQALHDVLNAEVRSAADKAALELRAQTLHLAIRFLLLQAHHSHHAIPELRHAIFRKSINSACKVYANLLDLLPLVVDSSPAEYLRLRERQTSALIRIVWACIGTVDFDAGEVQHDMIPVAQEEAAPPPDLPSVQQLLDVLDLTLTALPSSSSSTSAPLGISTRFWRRLLYILILPSAPSRRAGPLPAALRPPWPLLRRTFETILSARRHESTHPLLRSQPVAPRPLPVKEQRTTTTPSRAIPIASQALFLRTSFIFHLVRACLLGGSPSPSSSSSPEAEEQDPPARLAFLLEWISRMEGTTISRAEGRRGREVLRRGVVRSAVEEVAAKEWEGVVWKERRKVVRGLVVAWSEGETAPSSSVTESGAESTLINAADLPPVSTDVFEEEAGIILSPPQKRKPKWIH